MEREIDKLTQEQIDQLREVIDVDFNSIKVEDNLQRIDKYLSNKIEIMRLCALWR